MPLIAIPFLTGVNEWAARIVGCTFEQYEKYKLDMGFQEEINSHTIPTSFFTDYVTKKNCMVNDINNWTTKTIDERKDFISSWTHTNVLNIVKIRGLLDGFNLSYEDFIDAYAIYLKSYNL